jgi:hypothetical protein
MLLIDNPNIDFILDKIFYIKVSNSILKLFTIYYI